MNALQVEAREVAKKLSEVSQRNIDEYSIFLTIVELACNGEVTFDESKQDILKQTHVFGDTFEETKRMVDDLNAIIAEMAPKKRMGRPRSSGKKEKPATVTDIFTLCIEEENEGFKRMPNHREENVGMGIEDSMSKKAEKEAAKAAAAEKKAAREAVKAAKEAAKAAKKEKSEMGMMAKEEKMSKEAEKEAKRKAKAEEKIRKMQEKIENTKALLEKPKTKARKAKVEKVEKVEKVDEMEDLFGDMSENDESSVATTVVSEETMREREETIEVVEVSSEGEDKVEVSSEGEDKVEVSSEVVTEVENNKKRNELEFDYNAAAISMTEGGKTKKTEKKDKKEKRQETKKTDKKEKKEETKKTDKKEKKVLSLQKPEDSPKETMPVWLLKNADTVPKLLNTKTSENYIVRDNKCFTGSELIAKWLPNEDSIEYYGTKLVRYAETDGLKAVNISLTDASLIREGSSSVTSTKYLIDRECNIYDGDGDHVGVYSPEENTIVCVALDDNSDGEMDEEEYMSDED